MDSNPVRIEELLAHAGWVRKLAARLVRDAGTADDVTQEVWAYALRSPPGDRRNLRGWLAEVVHNAARSFGRSESRRAARESATTRVGSEESTDELVERGQLHRQLVEQLMALDEPYRSIVLAHWFEGESICEIARRLGLTPKMARTRLDAAHARLRQRMDEASGGRAVWSVAFVKWMAPREVAAIGGALVAKKIVLSGLAAGLLCFGWFAWPRAPVQRLDGVAAPLRTPDGLSSPPSDVAPTSADPRRSGSRIVVVDECAHPLSNARVTRDSTIGECLLGTTDDQGTLVLAPEDASGPANISHEGFETARVPEVKGPELRVTMLDTNAITGRVRSYLPTFRPELITVIAVEESAPDSIVARTTAAADGSFRLSCLQKDREFTVLAGGDGWVSSVPELTPFPHARTGEHDVELSMKRLFAAVLEFRDQDDRPAHLCAPGYLSGEMRTYSSDPGAIPYSQMCVEFILAGASPAWASRIPGSMVFLFRSDSMADELDTNHLEFSMPGYAEVSLDYVAKSVGRPIEPTRITVKRTVAAFGTVRVRFMANEQTLASVAACPQGKLILRSESAEPLEYRIAEPTPQMDITNIPVGRYRLLFAPRKGGGTIPDSEAQAPVVEITNEAIVDFPISLESFGSVRLQLLTKSGAEFRGYFVYRLARASRDATTGWVKSSGSAEIRSGPTPPDGFQGLRAGTYILTCLDPRPADPSPNADEHDVVVEVVAGQEQTLTVRLRAP